MSLFGRSVHVRLTATGRASTAWYLRNEPLWPLLKAVWKLRRMPKTEFVRAMSGYLHLRDDQGLPK
jgi:hypothetical protein